MHAYFKSICYLIRRNKYFFIGCLCGFVFSLISMPVINNCHKQLSSKSEYWSVDSGIDLRLLTKVQQWYQDVQQTDYEPVIIQPNTNHTEIDSVHNELVFNSDSMIRDKKLKFYRPRFHHTELKIKNKLLLCILIRKQFLIESIVNKPSIQSTSFYIRQLIGDFMNITSTKYFPDLQDDIIYFYPEIIFTESNEFFDSYNLLVSFNNGQSLETIHNPTQQPNHVAMINYLSSKNKLNEYSFFFLFTENTFVYKLNLIDFLETMTVSDYVFSTSNEITETESVQLKINYLKRNLFQSDSILNYGLLLSSSLLSRCQLQVDCCLQLIYNNNINANVIYWHESFNSEGISPSRFMIDFEKNQEKISNSITMFPKESNHQTNDLIYTIFAFEKILKLKNQTKQIENTIEKLRKQNQNFHSEWPYGVFGYQKPNTRYEIIRWSYWNESHVLMPNDIEVFKLLSDSQLTELNEIKTYCFEWIVQNKKNIFDLKPKQIEIKNLYRKFDAVRGLEYIVDIQFNKWNPSMLRFQIIKPLNQVEMITDIPYVTENMRITMVLPVRGHLEVPLAIKFLNNYANVCAKKSNHQTILIIALIHTRFLYLNDSIESNLELENNEFQRLKKVSLYVKSKYSSNSVKIDFLDIHPPDPVISSDFDTNKEDILYRYPSEMVYLDLIARSLSPITEQILILHCRANILFSTDYLNRVRLNTIVGKQIFMPIPFVEYRLRTTISNSIFKDMLQQSDLLSSIKQLVNQGKNFYFDVRKDNGYFDETNYEMVSFYLSDYVLARKTIESMFPIVHNHQSIVKNQKLYYNAKFDLNQLFTEYNKAQTSFQLKRILMRSVEPELKLTYESILNNCQHFESNIHALESCKHRQIFGLGPKQKLASIVLKYLQIKSKNKK